MQKIISMLLIGIMLTGCGKFKDLTSPSASANAELTAIKAEIEALKAKGQGGPNANADVASLKAKLEALEAKDKVEPKANADVASLKAKLEALEAKDKVEPKANADLPAMKAEIEALKAKNSVDPKVIADLTALKAKVETLKPNTQADLVEIKAEMAALKDKNTKGWWNWRASEDGWKSWISTPTIAITAVFVVASSVYSLYKIRSLYNIVSDHINNYYNPSVDAFKEAQEKIDEHTEDIANLKIAIEPDQET